MIIKKVLNDLVIYCKTKGGQNDLNDWKNEQNTQILLKIQKFLVFEWRILGRLQRFWKSQVPGVLKVYNDYGSSEARKSTGTQE